MVRCAECGFLVVRHRDDECTVSPGAEQRQTGRAPAVLERSPGSPLMAMDRHLLETQPVCSRGCCRLDEEYTALYPHDHGQWSPGAVQAAAAVMQKDRDCAKFISWIPALSPKEHLAMLGIKEMLGEHNTRADATAQREREWRKEDMELALSNLRAARVNTAGVWAGVAVALTAALISIVLSVRNLPTRNEAPPPAAAAPAPSAPAQ